MTATEMELELEDAAEAMAAPQRGQAGRFPARGLVSHLRRQGFILKQHFLDRLLERAQAQGIRFDPRSFPGEFRASPHFRQTRPGYNTRFAVLRGLPILYRMGGPRGLNPVLVGLLPQGALPPSEPVSPPILREAEFEQELGFAAGELEGDQAEPFFTRVQPVPHLPGYEEGHEVLTRSAASGLVAGADLNALLLGVIRPDRGGSSYWNFPRAALHSFSSSAQRSHALRRAPSTPQAAALAEIRRHLTSLYSLALRASNRATALGWVGEALHLIQDAYSGAHMERALGAGAGGTSPIRRIRVFNLSVWPPSRSTAPLEHNVPSDPRDSVWASPGVLRRESSLAVRASREYLAMSLRHLANPRAPSKAAEFRSFMNRHFSF